MYEIRLCRSDEYNKLAEFLHKYWREDHIFARDKQVLDWQHKEADHYNFIVANHIESDEFHAILGIISPSFYSKGRITIGDNIWLAIWKVENSLAQASSLGVELFEFVVNEYRPASISAIGISEAVKKLYRLLGMKPGVMTQYYIKNPTITDSKIAVFSQKPAGYALDIGGGNQLENISKENLDEFMEKLSFPLDKKGIEYITNRYIHHPRYRYMYLGLSLDKQPAALFVARAVETACAKCLRVVDFIGLEELPDSVSIKETVECYLAAQCFEYADFLYFGPYAEKIVNLGFSIPSEAELIPHLFEPFVKETVEVHLSYSGDQEFSAVKGDSDLDRPNL